MGAAGLACAMSPRTWTAASPLRRVRPPRGSDEAVRFALGAKLHGQTTEAMQILAADCGIGAAYRTRTCDPLITNEVLYQLS